MAGIISPLTLEQIRSASDIVEVISAVVPLKRAGLSFVALCPFHREKTPSFHVNPRKQTFHCFGCHKGGDVFTFVREYESLEFIEAVKRLAERARIPLEFGHDPKYQEKQFLKDKLLEINEQITQRWHHCLLSDAAGQPARDYLAERAVSDEAVQLFRLGFAPESWDDTVNWAKGKGYDLGLVEQAGLALRKEEGEHRYGRFRGRLMFPICDDQGRVIGFSGRVLPGSNDPRKYVNSPETLLFTKSRVMYGLDKSKRAILERQFALVCEGQLDLISCFMAGVKNIVAPQGTAFTSEHARIIKRYANEVVLCFDSDEAGQKAAVRVLDDLLGTGLAIKVVTIPPPDDPDSFIKKFGAAAFEALIGRAEGFFDFYLNRLCALHDLRTDKGRKAVVEAMAEAAAKTGDGVLIDTYAQKTAGRLGVGRLSVAARFKTVQPAPERQERAEQPGVEAPPAEEEENWRPNAQEFGLIRILLGYDETVDWARKFLHPDWLQNRHVREIVERRLGWGGGGQMAEPAEPAAMLFGMESNPSARSLITEALAEERPLPKPEQQVVEVVTRLRNQSIDREMAVLMQTLGQPELSEEDKGAVLRELDVLRAGKRQPLEPLPARA